MNATASLILGVVAISATTSAPMTARGTGQTDIAANEASAIGALRAINSGQAAYSSSCADGGFAARLDDLARPPRGSQFGYISPQLATSPNDWRGYAIKLGKNASPGVVDVGTTEATCNGSVTTPVNMYFASAEPLTPGTSGRRFFATDQRGTIFFSSTPIANPIVTSDTVQPIR